MIPLSTCLLLAILALSLLQSAILAAAYSKIDAALQPVISMRAAIAVLTDEITRLGNRISLVSAVGEGAVSVVKSAAESDAVQYVKSGAARVYDRIRGRKEADEIK